MIHKFVFLLFILHVQSAVLGIDFGSNFVKVAVVAPGHPFKIALDGTGKRKAPAVIGFDDGERRFGNDAKTLITKKPKETYMYMARLLGKSIDSPLVQDFATHYYPYDFVSDERGTIRVKFGEEKTFSMEEIVSMYLRQAANVAVSFLESSTPIRDCVITVPDFWSTKERVALLDAAKLAGLNVLSLVNENSAAALYYGVEMIYDVNKTENFIFYNMGSSSTKVSVVEYSAFLKKITKRKNKTVGMVSVLSQAWDETLGGNTFDLSITKKLKAEAEKAMKVDLSDNVRALARIRVAAETAKRKLSANTDNTVRITSLYDDTDFRYTVNREEFLQDSADLLERAMVPLEEALTRSGLEKDDIEAIVLFGGGTRIPKLKEMLTDFLDGKKLRKDINTDEAAALGAAFLAANESTSFRIRQIGFVDRGALGVGATFNNFADFENGADLENAEFRKSAEIFDPTTPFKKRKSVHFKHDEDLHVSLSYTSEENLPAGTTQHIQHYNVSGVKGAVEKYAEKNVTDTKPKISLSFVIDSSGIAKLAKATATFQENVEVAIPKVKNETTTIETPEKTDEKAEETTDEKAEESTDEKTEESTDEKEGESTDDKAEESTDEKEEESTDDKAEESTDEKEEESTDEKEEESTDEKEEESTDEKAEESTDEKAEESTEEKEEDSTAEKEEDSESGEDASETEEAEKSDDSEKSDEAAEGTDAAEEAKEAEKVEPVIEYEYVWQVQKRKVPLKIRRVGSDLQSLSREHHEASKKVLLELDEADQAIRDTAQAFNDLEAYILERRPLLYEDEDEHIMKVSTEETREELIALLNEVEDWLYDEEEPSAGKFKSKMRDVQKQVNPVFMRAYELTQRAFMVDQTRDYIEMMQKTLANLTETMTWVNATEFEKLQKSCDDLQEWFDKKVAEQAELQLTEDPAFKVDTLRSKVEKLSDKIKLIARRPKPAPKPKKKKKRKKKASNETSTEETSEAPEETETSGEPEASEKTEESETTEETTEAEETETTEQAEEETSEPETTEGEEELSDMHTEL